jgi:hypothetical protein
MYVYALGEGVFFYYLVANLSLRLKWGALPLSIAISLVGSFLTGAMAVLMFREAAIIVLDVALVILIGLLHVDIGRRLEQLAAED